MDPSDAVLIIISIELGYIAGVLSRIATEIVLIRRKDRSHGA